MKRPQVDRTVQIQERKESVKIKEYLFSIGYPYAISVWQILKNNKTGISRYCRVEIWMKGCLVKEMIANTRKVLAILTSNYAYSIYTYDSSTDELDLVKGWNKIKWSD